MSEMNKLSELYEESNDLQMDVMPGESDLPHIKKTLFDQLAFIGEFSLTVVSRLTEELGCDEIIDRE
ncbi:hypothetical protein CapIbe_008535 [Capra ibex]